MPVVVILIIVIIVVIVAIIIIGTVIIMFALFSKSTPVGEKYNPFVWVYLNGIIYRCMGNF